MIEWHIFQIIKSTKMSKCQFQDNFYIFRLKTNIENQSFAIKCVIFDLNAFKAGSSLLLVPANGSSRLFDEYWKGFTLNLFQNSLFSVCSQMLIKYWTFFYFRYKKSLFTMTKINKNMVPMITLLNIQFYRPRKVSKWPIFANFSNIL